MQSSSSQNKISLHGLDRQQNLGQHSNCTAGTRLLVWNCRVVCTVRSRKSYHHVDKHSRKSSTCDRLGETTADRQEGRQRFRGRCRRPISVSRCQGHSSTRRANFPGHAVLGRDEDDRQRPSGPRFGRCSRCGRTVRSLDYVYCGPYQWPSSGHSLWWRSRCRQSKTCWHIPASILLCTGLRCSLCFHLLVFHGASLALFGIRSRACQDGWFLRQSFGMELARPACHGTAVPILLESTHYASRSECISYCSYLESGFRPHIRLGLSDSWMERIWLSCLPDGHN